MKKIYLIVACATQSFFCISQTANLKNLSLDVNYGMTGFVNSDQAQDNVIDAGHLDVGLRLMKGRVWGVKFGIGLDKTRITNNGLQSGCDYKRFTLQTVCNLNYLCHSTDDILAGYNPKLNLFINFGGGYSSQTSTLFDGTDQMGHVIFGISPKYKISKDFSLGIELNGVINLSRHFDFDGRKIYNGTRISETGFIYNPTITLNYVLWREYKKVF